MIPIAKPYLTKDEAQSAYDVVLSGWVTQGPKVEEFEKKFCEYTGAEYSVATSNGTTALHLALIVAGIKQGDEVICPSMSYIATANCIRYISAKPVFADVKPVTYNIDIKDAERKITEKTKAIMIVHQIGMPAEIDEFKKLCDKYNLKLIEDAACATGSAYKGKKIGTHSELVCFSFHPRKVITTGEGGMITTNNKAHYDRLKLLRQHAISFSSSQRHLSDKISFEEHIETGYNYRMTDIQASIGIKQLEKLDWIIEERRKIALRYLNELKDIKEISLPTEEKDFFSNYQSFCIYINKSSPISRNELMQKLLEAGISTRRGVMTSHREKAYSENYSNTVLPVSEDISDNSIIIPLYVPMNEEDVSRVIENLRKYLKYGIVKE
ncbi:MAG: DegT/DnrJ/EryC1/StrS family aminotransferase [Ignavibacteria bacterium]